MPSARLKKKLIITSHRPRRRRPSNPFITYHSNWVFWLMTLARVLQAATILVWPVLGYLIAVGLDTLDGQVLRWWVGMSSKDYHWWDKVIDISMQLAALVAISLYTAGGPVVLALLGYRFLGVGLYLLKPSKWLFLWFPNLVEVGFAWYFLVEPYLIQPQHLTSPVAQAGLAIGLVVAKLTHEWLNHFAWNHYLTPRLRAWRLKHWGTAAVGRAVA